ncbi:MAG: hypothetical protein GY788_28565 [bacterium]|nr:hypothetical protein [bacterium]
MLEADQATSLSEQLVENPGVNLAQVRRDLSYIGDTHHGARSPDGLVGSRADL